MQQSKKTIVLGADVECDKMVADVLMGVFKPEEIIVHRYNKVKFHRKLLNVDTATWWNDLEVDLKAELKIGLPCRTKKEAKKARHLAKRLKIRYKLYTSEEDDSTMEDFKHLNERWVDVQLVIFSSKVTVGADCILEFDKIYINADSFGGCNARNILQMTGRFRNVKDPVMKLVCRESKVPQFPTFEEQVQFFYDRREVMQDALAGYVRFVPEFSPSGVKWAPDWVTAAFAHSRVERCRDFQIDLFTKALDKGYTVMEANKCELEEDRQQEVMEEMYEISDEVKDFDEMEQSQMFHELHPEYKDLHGEADKAVRTHTATKQDRMVCEMNAVLKHFPNESLDYEQFVLARKHLAQIRNVAAVQRMNGQALADRDLHMLERTPWAELTQFNLFKKSHGSIDTLMRSLGFEELFDTDTEVPKEALKQHRESIRSVCNKLSLLRGVKPRELTGSDEDTVTKDILNRELKATFACSLTRKQRGKKKAVVYKIEKIKHVHELVDKSDYFVDEEEQVEWTGHCEEKE